MSTNNAYQQAGVDIQMGDRFVDFISPFVKKTLNKNVMKIPNGYAGLYKISESTFIAASTDGVGTKLKLAMDLDIHDTVGFDLVAMSVNDLLCVGAKPLMFLDYFATGKLSLKTAGLVVKGIAQACETARTALVGGETAEMPGFYQNGEYDLAGFAVGLLQKKEMLDGSKVKEGHMLLGLASSGFHSNGYSLVRKLIEGKDLQFKKNILTPTMIYVDAVELLRKKLKTRLKGLAHITGSGFLNIPRLNEHHDYYIEYDYKKIWNKSCVEVVRNSKLSLKELFTTFNMGVGMVAALEWGDDKTGKDPLQETIAALKKIGVTAFPLGWVGEKTRKNPKVIVRAEEGSVELQY